MCSPAAAVSVAVAAYGVAQQRSNAKAVERHNGATLAATQAAAEADRNNQQVSLKQRQDQIEQAASIVAQRDARRSQAALSRIQVLQAESGVVGSAFSDLMTSTSFAAAETEAIHQTQLEFDQQQILDAINAVDAQAQSRVNAAAAGLPVVPGIDYSDIIGAIGKGVIDAAARQAPADTKVSNPSASLGRQTGQHS